MAELLGFTVMFAVLGYFFIAVFGGVAGGAAIILGGLFAAAALFAGLLVSYLNTRQRLARLEKKLDRLTEELASRTAPEVSELEELDGV